MSLYGALFGAVSGLSAQSSKIGVISDNIANSNTIGYKQASATFESLVINSSSAGKYQTGGVRGGSVYQIDKQGLLQSTSSATDVAISGGGFFVVRAAADGSSAPLYTRAGSFTQDSLGNFVNSAGFFLQGWPLDREGRLPGEVGNLNTTSFTNFDSLQTVNVKSASGTAQATSTVALGANLKSSQTVYPGEAATLAPDTNVSNNLLQPAASILVGAEYGLEGANGDGMHRGDQFSISTGGGQIYTYEYGGFTAGRKVSDTDSTTNNGDAGLNNKATYAIAANELVATTGATFTLTVPNHNLITGDKITLSGFADAGSTPAAEINSVQTVTRVNANTISFTVNTAHGLTNQDSGPGTADIRRFEGTIFDAQSSTGVFLARTGVTGYTDAALQFTITSESAGGTKTFTYTTAAPNVLNGEFNNLNTLAQAIDAVNGLTARVVDGRLLVSSENASDEVTFANGDVDGANDGSARGIDWLKELDLSDIALGTRRFNSFQGLAAIVNSDDGLTATISNPLSAATLSIRVNDPLDTIQFADLAVPTEFDDTANAYSIEMPAAGTYAAGDTVDVLVVSSATVTVGQTVTFEGLTRGLGGLPGNLPNGTFEIVAAGSGTFTVRMTLPQAVTLTASGNGTHGGNGYDATANSTFAIVSEQNQGSILGALGLVDSLNGTDYITAGLQETDVLGPQYDPSGSVGQNMASGDITAQFSRNVRVYDGLGSGHDLRFSFIKIATNRWAVEVHAIPETDVAVGGGFVDGQVAVGNITFNGDGTLRSVDAALTNPISVSWTNGSTSSELAIDWGTAGEPFGTVGAAAIGLSDGLSQFDSAYNVNFANQNGAAVGQLVSVSIDGEGVIVASYSNGQTQSLFKLPLAEFPNPNGLQPVSGNVFSQTRDSGEVNLREAGTNGTGTVVSATLEQSNVDLANELTDMIVAQRAYQANTRVIKTSDELLEQLNNI